jgi:hypothetical protein
MNRFDRYELDAPSVRRLLDEAAEIAERLRRDYERLGEILSYELRDGHLEAAADEWTTDPLGLAEWADHWRWCFDWAEPPRPLPRLVVRQGAVDNDEEER